jgi:hypothetical protein
MSQRNRRDLTDLAGLRKPLVPTGPVQDEVPTEGPLITPLVIPHEVPREVPREVQPKILQQRRDKRRLIAQSFKLPADLDERWSAIASFNKVTKTGILLEALETFLDRLPQPPAKG